MHTTDVISSCKNYFNGFNELSTKGNISTSVIAVLKIVSYFFLIIPAIMGATYGIASLIGRIKNLDKIDNADQKVQNIAASRIQNQFSHPTEAKRFPVKAQTVYTLDPTTLNMQRHVVKFDPFLFADQGIVCLPNPSARCWLTSFLQIFMLPNAELNLSSLGLTSTKELLPPKQTFASERERDQLLEEMHKKIQQILQKIVDKKSNDLESPEDFIDLFDSEIQLSYGDEPQGKRFFIEHKKDSLPMEKKAGDNTYELIGVISAIPGGGHWYPQIPRFDSNGSISWYSCNRFASLSSTDDGETPIEGMAPSAIVEKSSSMHEGPMHLLVYKKL